MKIERNGKPIAKPSERLAGRNGATVKTSDMNRSKSDAKSVAMLAPTDNRTDVSGEMNVGRTDVSGEKNAEKTDKIG